MVFYFFNPKRNGTRAILSMSAKEPGRYQITYFVYSEKAGKFIPWSDSIRNSIRKCLQELDQDGFQREKIKHFNLFDRPESFSPTRVLPKTRSERWVEKFLINMRNMEMANG